MLTRPQNLDFKVKVRILWPKKTNSSREELSAFLPPLRQGRESQGGFWVV